MRKTKPEESLCTLDVAIVVANNHHVVLVPGRIEIRMNMKIRWIKVVRQIRVIAEIKNIKKEKNQINQNDQRDHKDQYDQKMSSSNSWLVRIIRKITIFAFFPIDHVFVYWE